MKGELRSSISFKCDFCAFLPSYMEHLQNNCSFPNILRTQTLRPGEDSRYHRAA